MGRSHCAQSVYEQRMVVNKSPLSTGTTSPKLTLHTAALAFLCRRGHCSVTNSRNPTLTVGSKHNRTPPSIWCGRGITQSPLWRVKELRSWKRKGPLIESVTVSSPCFSYTKTALPSKGEGNASGPFVCVCVCMCVCACLCVSGGIYISAEALQRGMSFAASCQALCRNSLQGIPVSDSK